MHDSPYDLLTGGRPLPAADGKCRTRWNFTAASRLLDVQRTCLHQKAKILGIRRPRAETNAEGEEE